MNNRPNIVIIMVDEINVAATSVYGHPFVLTPNMQRLADGGVTVERAYCNSPLCVPSRASFVTGRYASQIRVYDLNSSLASGEPTFAHAFNASGYETVLAGKMHFVGQDQRHGFQKRLVEDCHGDGTHHGIPDWDAPPRKATKLSERLVNGGRAGVSKYVQYDYKVAEATVRYLEEYAQSDRSNPFLLCTGFISPHFPLVVEEPYFNMYYPDLADLPMHPELPNHPKYRRIQQHFNLAGPFPEDRIRRARADYYGLITFVDRLIGRIIDVLDAAGLGDNTLILLTSDHGEMMGEHGLWWKSCFLEEAARVPMICRWPNRLPPGERRKNVLSLVDVFPTILQAADISIPDFIVGHSFLPLLENGDLDWKDEAFIECLAHTAVHPEAAVIKGRYKYIYFVDEPDQLFDLDTDPHELVDLAGRPEFQPYIEEIKKDLLSKWPVREIDEQVRLSQRLRRYVKAGTP
jgi:choline-sulfatase